MDEVKESRNTQLNFTLDLPDTSFGSCKYPTLTKQRKTRIDKDQLHNYVGTNGMIVSIEASKKLAEFNKRLFENDNNAMIINGYGFPVYELANKINIDKFDETGGSLGGTVTYSKSLSSNIESQSEIYDLKSIIHLSKIEPDVLVIDIEGSEKILLDQIPQFPAKIRIILIELHPHLYGINTMNLIISSITNEGFKIIAEKRDVYLFERKLNN